MQERNLSMPRPRKTAPAAEETVQQAESDVGTMTETAAGRAEADASMDEPLAAGPVTEGTVAEEPVAVVEDVASPADAATDAVVLGQQQAIETAEAAGNAVMEGMGRFHRELVDFVSERIRQDMEAQSAMLRCRSFDDLRAVQTQFLRTAMDQYADEANRLMRLGAEMMQRSVSREG
jgi:hypothetical protein